MAQKINPISLRLQYTNRYFDNSWYSKKYYEKLVTKDVFIQKYINTFLKLLKLPLGRFSIQHLPKKTRLFNFFCYPKISREYRSKIFGVKNPYFFKKKRFFHNKQQFFGKNSKSLNKSLYNKNLWFSLNYFKALPKKSNFNILSCIKNTGYFRNNFFIFNKRIKDKKQEFSGVKNSISLVSLKQNNSMNSNLSGKNINYNDVFLKFFINLIIYSTLKLEKKRLQNTNVKINSKSKKKELRYNKVKNAQNIKKAINQYDYSNLDYQKMLFKYFLIFSQCSNNIYNTSLQKKQATLSRNNGINHIFLQNLKKCILFDTNLVDFLNKINAGGAKKHSFFEKGSKSVLKINKNNKKIDLVSKLWPGCNTNHNFNELQANQKVQNSELQIVDTDFLSLQVCNTKYKTNELHNTRITKLKNHLNSSLSSIYNLNRIQNNHIFDVSNYWKLNNLENKYKYKNYIQRSLASIYNIDFEFIPFKIKNDWQSAGFLADELVFFLERRVPFRRLKNKLLNQIAKNSNIRGIRITCSGRVGGKSKKAQRAKTECVKLGQTSLHVFSNQIDFAVRTAHTIFGSVGIKVWVSYN